MSSSLGRFAVFAGSLTSLQLEPHRFLKCRQLWRRFMQCSFGTSSGSNDEAICLIDSVESHVPQEDDTHNVDTRIVRASNASEPSLQVMARADWGFMRWPSMDVHQLLNQTIRGLSDRGAKALTTFLSLASADSRRALSRCVFGCFITALWDTTGFASIANYS